MTERAEQLRAENASLRVVPVSITEDLNTVLADCHREIYAATLAEVKSHSVCKPSYKAPPSDNPIGKRKQFASNFDASIRSLLPKPDTRGAGITPYWTSYKMMAEQRREKQCFY